MDQEPGANLLDIENILQRGSPEELQRLFGEVHPSDLADALEELEEERRDEVFAIMPPEVFGELIEHIPSDDVREHLKRSSTEYQQEVLAELPDDELVDLLQELPEEEREVYVELLPEPVQEASRLLMSYPENSAGGRMTTDVATVRETLTIGEAIQHLDAIKETSELLSRIYVVDAEQRLLGKLRLRDLTFNPRDKLIREVMDGDVLCVEALADQEEAARLIARYDLIALPVVNQERQLLGLVTHDDAMEILEEEASEDIEMISGIQVDEEDEDYLRTSVFRHFRRRFLWVAAMAFVGIASGYVLYRFEDFLGTVPILALYLSTVVASGGNTGSQAATMVIRAMSLGEFRLRDFTEVLWKELRIGLSMGSMVGVCFFLQILWLNFAALPPGVSGWQVGIAVGLAITLQITCSTLVGASLPLIARSLGQDPAAASAPVITTLVDVVGITIYFNIARSVLGF